LLASLGLSRLAKCPNKGTIPHVVCKDMHFCDFRNLCKLFQTISATSSMACMLF